MHSIQLYGIKFAEVDSNKVDLLEDCPYVHFLSICLLVLFFLETF